MERPFPAYTGTEPYIFVCYAHEDAPLVYPELQRLHESGVNIWYDEGIAPGHEWTEFLARAIDGASRFVYFVSPTSVESVHCRREIHYALDQQKAVVSVHLEPTELPGGLKLSLGLDQAILKYEMDDGAYRRKLSRALRTPEAATDAELQPDRATRPSRRATFVGSIACTVLLIAAALWWHQRAPSVAPAGAPESSGSTVGAPDRPAIAVLPFANMSNDPDQEFFSDGISEDILNGLARSPKLIVRPRSTSFQFKASGQDSQAIGRQLNVSHILEGSVRTSDKRVRVSAQLIDVANNQSVWSERFDRNLVDVFAVQDAITAEILTALNAQLIAPDTTREFASREAYDAFLRGRHQFNRYDFAEADRWLANAVELDPKNADAWALRAQINAFQSAVELGPNGGEHREARRAYIEHALTIDPDNVLALANRALMDTHFVDRNFQSAVDELARLVVLHPNNEDALIYLSFVLATIGRPESVDRVTRQLVTLAPLSMNARVARIGYGLLLFGRIEDARRELIEFSSLGFSFPSLQAQLALADRDATELRGVLEDGGLSEQEYVLYASIAAFMVGDFEQARTLLAPLKQTNEYVSHHRKCMIALLERDLDGALAHYADAIRAAEQYAIAQTVGTIGVRTVFPEFYADPRYARMLEEFGLDPASTARINVPDLPF